MFRAYNLPPNTETGDKVDRFWLEGPLKISAVEQTKFLARLAHGDGWVLYGKTGWTSAPSPDIGWWVGWVVKDNRIYSFAINIDMPTRADVAKRVELGRACLKALGIIES